MQTLESHVTLLVESGDISAETARSAVADPNSLRLPGETKSRKKSKG